MSLLDRGPHTVTVQPKTAVPDRLGGNKYVNSGAPVDVRCSVQPLSAEELKTLGLEAVTTYRVLCRSWPGGIHSEVNWNGRPFSQHGEATVYSTGRRTAHTSVVIKAVDAEVR